MFFLGLFHPGQTKCWEYSVMIVPASLTFSCTDVDGPDSPRQCFYGHCSKFMQFVLRELCLACPTCSQRWLPIHQWGSPLPFQNRIMLWYTPKFMSCMARYRYITCMVRDAERWGKQSNLYIGGLFIHRGRGCMFVYRGFRSYGCTYKGDVLVHRGSV